MAVNVRNSDIDQLMMMPPSVRDWIPEDHLAFFVQDVVSVLDLSAFYGAHRSDGRGGATYSPEIMLGILFYAYCTGDRSSRMIERRLIEDVAMRVVAANQKPDHATLARFRRRHQDAIAALFTQVLKMCAKAGLVDAGLVSIDGTKLSANASFFANRDKDSLAKELDKIDSAESAAKTVLDEAERVDAREDAQADAGPEPAPGSVPPQWSGGRDRRARLRAALDELESQNSRDFQTRVAERARKEAETGKKMRGPKPKEDAARRSKPRKANVTDPHSRVIANASKGVVQGYNAQAAATVGQVILAAEVTVTTNDQPHFLPMTRAVTENLTDAAYDGGVGTFLADAGYWTTTNATTDIGADVLIATRKTAWRKADKPDDDKLAVLAKVNRGELSQRAAGDLLSVSYTWIRDMTKRYFGTEGQRITPSAEPEPQEWIPVIERLSRGEISQRAAADTLTVSTSRVKAMLAHVNGEAPDPAITRKRMDDKLSEEDNAAKYKKRSASIEPVFGNIKENMKFRRFSLRSLAGAQSEWRLVCSAHNLLKLHRATLA